jgi:hypothetical protein
MADKTKWAALVAAVGCPMDAPRPASNDHWDPRVVLPGETDANFGRWALPVMPRAIPGMPRTFLMRAMRVAD